MKKCSNCGYVRRPDDDKYAMVPSRACPKCYAFYTPEQTEQPQPVQDIQANDKKIGAGPAVPPKQGMSRAAWISILAVAVVVSFVTAYYLAGRTKGTSISFSQGTGKAVTDEASPAGLPLQEYSISEIVKRISPSIISVMIYDDRRQVVGWGSGFFAGNPGEVVTNRHVLKGSYYEIKTIEGRTYPVNRIVSEDAHNDLVVLATGASLREAVPLKISRFRPERGEKVVVIGSPLGLEQSVSDGIVSAYRELKNRKVIQITAPISQGSSGSPVVNMRGEVIGIVSMYLMQGQNLNFCVPAETLLNISSAMSHLGNLAPVPSSQRLYFYQDENKRVHFVRNPENPRSNYILLTRSDGSIDREKFENWIFEQMGGNPYKIDPQAMVNAEKERLPDLFRQVFPGHEMDELKRFSPEARGYWGSWVANHMQAVYNRAQSDRNSGINKHREMMTFLDRVLERESIKQ